MDRLQKLAYKYRFHIASFFLPVIAIAIGYADEAPEANPRDQSKIVFVE